MGNAEPLSYLGGWGVVTGCVPIIYMFVEAEITPFQNVRCVTFYFLVSCAITFFSCCSLEDIRVVDKGVVPYSLVYIFACYGLFPSLLEKTNCRLTTVLPGWVRFSVMDLHFQLLHSLYESAVWACLLFSAINNNVILNADILGKDS